jgi:signal transduction histidine kinase
VKLVEDLLDVSRIVAGNLRLASEDVDLALTVRDAVDSVRQTAEAKGVRLDVDVDAPVGMVRGDRERLQQVVWNLLSNAVKFTPPGGSVRLLLRRDGPFAELTVADTGEGISPEFLPYVFDRFRQADASHTRIHGGLGLGLAIVRHLVEAHSGIVRGESEGKGRGATFVVRLPISNRTAR